MNKKCLWKFWNPNGGCLQIYISIYNFIIVIFCDEYKSYKVVSAPVGASTLEEEKRWSGNIPCPLWHNLVQVVVCN